MIEFLLGALLAFLVTTFFANSWHPVGGEPRWFYRCRVRIWRLSDAMHWPTLGWTFLRSKVYWWRRRRTPHEHEWVRMRPIALGPAPYFYYDWCRFCATTRPTDVEYVPPVPPPGLGPLGF